MKLWGIIVTLFGFSMLGTSINLAFTKYDLSKEHDLSVFFGGLAISILVLGFGVHLLTKKSKEQ